MSNNFNPEKYRILAVDDSTLILNMVETALKRAGFQVSTAISGEDALDLIKQQGLPHLALVDINMPFGMDGFEFCEQLHQFSDVPVIMLTAIDEQDTIIHAIEQFAEDYITKPFSPGELVARVRRVLRRLGNFPYDLNALTRVDEHLTVDFPGCQIILNGKPISLTPTETKLLYILMRSAGKIMSFNFLMQRLWPMESTTEERLRVYVHRLRKKIEPDSANPRYIMAERGKGYGFVASTHTNQTET
ncbi:MAG: DNA-binding response regulator [Chloroflexi bacterium]|nr:MAG: DNA-binding response regulator [Chloroflexota bacterium]